MLQVNHLSKAYGDIRLLQDISFVVNPGERVGLIGPNGCGKTTLLRIIVGQEEPDQGSVRLAPDDQRIGYLAQALTLEPGATVDDVMRQAADERAEAEREIERLGRRIAAADGNEREKAMAAYADALARLEAAGGYGLDHEIDAVLTRLGLEAIEPETPVAILSGGQKTRLGLARLLLRRPQILLLDEPTNHLDIAALEWLETFLAGYDGGVLIVSHDRTFLNRTVSTILELSPLTHQITAYAGDYDDYRQAKARDLEQQWAAYKNQQTRIDQLQGEIQGLDGHARRIEQGTIHYHYRKVAKGLARRAVVQRRRLERLLESEERVEKPRRRWKMKLEFEPAPESGKDVLRLEDVAMGYGSTRLFTEVTLTLRQGERVVLVGPNGCGKTTLLRGIAGHLAPLVGRIRLGTNVKVGHYAQEQEGLDEQSSPFETIRRVASMNETETRRFLHKFLFSGDEVFWPVSELSYGERARLALARLVAGGCNLLLLDEPINHLDIPSRERFEEGLAAFEGTILAVVHDRYFIQRFASALWVVEGGGIRRTTDVAGLKGQDQGA